MQTNNPLIVKNWNVREVLQKKVEELGGYLNPLADLISDANREFDNSIANIDEDIKALQAHKKKLQKQKQDINSQISLFLMDELGVEKIEGDRVSSITCTKYKGEVIKEDFVFTPSISKAEIEVLLMELGKGDFELVRKVTPPKASSIKINKRRIEKAEVIKDEN